MFKLNQAITGFYYEYQVRSLATKKITMASCFKFIYNRNGQIPFIWDYSSILIGVIMIASFFYNTSIDICKFRNCRQLKLLVKIILEPKQYLDDDDAKSYLYHWEILGMHQIYYHSKY